MLRNSTAIFLIAAAASIGFIIVFSLASANYDPADDTPLLSSLVEAPEDEVVIQSRPPRTNLQGPAVTMLVTNQSKFVWPAQGPITSYFGSGHPGGIDIGLGASSEAPILASAAGTVSFAGGVRCCDYGYHVVIDHGDGLTTLYGHLSRIDVETGQQVTQGQQLGLGGDTGISDGIHLHFEIHKDGQLADPLTYLATDRTPGASLPAWPASCPSDSLLVQPASHVALDLSLTGNGRVTSANITPLTNDSRPELISQPQLGERSIAFDVAPADGSNARVFYYLLTAIVVDGDLQQTIECEISTTTIRSQPNSENTAARLRAQAAAAAATATAEAEQGIVEATPTSRVPTATPVPPKATAGPSNSAPPGLTPNAPKAPTTQPPKALTSEPPKSITVQPPKGLTPQPPKGRN